MWVWCHACRVCKERRGYVKFAREASGIARILADNGLRFIYHNHNFEFVKFDGNRAEILLNETDPDVLTLRSIHTGYCRGGNPSTGLRKLGTYEGCSFQDMGQTATVFNP